MEEKICEFCRRHYNPYQPTRQVSCKRRECDNARRRRWLHQRQQRADYVARTQGPVKRGMIAAGQMYHCHQCECRLAKRFYIHVLDGQRVAVCGPCSFYIRRANKEE